MGYLPVSQSDICSSHGNDGQDPYSGTTEEHAKAQNPCISKFSVPAHDA